VHTSHSCPIREPHSIIVCVSQHGRVPAKLQSQLVLRFFDAIRSRVVILHANLLAACCQRIQVDASASAMTHGLSTKTCTIFPTSPQLQRPLPHDLVYLPTMWPYMQKPQWPNTAPKCGSWRTCCTQSPGYRTSTQLPPQSGWYVQYFQHTPILPPICRSAL